MVEIILVLGGHSIKLSMIFCPQRKYVVRNITHTTCFLKLSVLYITTTIPYIIQLCITLVMQFITLKQSNYFGKFWEKKKVK